MKTYMKPEARTIKMVASAQLMAAVSGQIDHGDAKPNNKFPSFWLNNDDDSSSDETEYSLDSPLWK